MPRDSPDVVIFAWPLTFSVAVPICNPSATNRTVPPGVPAPLVTVAVRVTGLPTGTVVIDALTVTVVGDSSAKAGVGDNADKNASKPVKMKSRLNAGACRLKYQREAVTNSLGDMQRFQDRTSIEEIFRRMWLIPGRQIHSAQCNHHPKLCCHQKMETTEGCLNVPVLDD